MVPFVARYLTSSSTRQKAHLPTMYYCGLGRLFHSAHVRAHQGGLKFSSGRGERDSRSSLLLYTLEAVNKQMYHLEPTWACPLSVVVESDRGEK